MPLHTSAVGKASEPVTHEVDARWAMAFAAALDDLLPTYFDTTAGQQVLAHPLFPISLEWDTIGRAGIPGAGTMSPEEQLREVHGTYDLELTRPLRSGDVLTAAVSVEAIEQRRPGGFRLVRVDGTDVRGEPVWVGRWGLLYRGVDVVGDAGPPAPPAPEIGEPTGEASEAVLSLPANLAHTFTECARIWNPIHTDAGIAEQAGLPGPILHGSATLAAAVSRIVTDHASPAAIRRIAGRFGAMVQLPTELRLEVTPVRSYSPHRAVAFTVHGDGGAVIRDGLIEVGEPAS